MRRHYFVEYARRLHRVTNEYDVAPVWWLGISLIVTMPSAARSLTVREDGFAFHPTVRPQTSVVWYNATDW